MGWLRYSAGDDIFTNILAREVPERKRSLADEAIYVHIVTVKFYFLCTISFL